MEEKYGWTPQSFQLAGIQAQLEGVDMALQAPTGAGKTAIVAGAHLWPHNELKVTIMVSPLLSLEDEMVCPSDCLLSIVDRRGYLLS